MIQTTSYVHCLNLNRLLAALCRVQGHQNRGLPRRSKKGRRTGRQRTATPHPFVVPVRAHCPQSTDLKLRPSFRAGFVHLTPCTTTAQRRGRGGGTSALIRGRCCGCGGLNAMDRQPSLTNDDSKAHGTVWMCTSCRYPATGAGNLFRRWS